MAVIFSGRAINKAQRNIGEILIWRLSVAVSSESMRYDHMKLNQLMLADFILYAVQTRDNHNINSIVYIDCLVEFVYRAYIKMRVDFSVSALGLHDARSDSNMNTSSDLPSPRTHVAIIVNLTQDQIQT